MPTVEEEGGGAEAGSPWGVVTALPEPSPLQDLFWGLPAQMAKTPVAHGFFAPERAVLDPVPLPRVATFR